jgi:hypothetical protein
VLLVLLVRLMLLMLLVLPVPLHSHPALAPAPRTRTRTRIRTCVRACTVAHVRPASFYTKLTVAVLSASDVTARDLRYALPRLLLCAVQLMLPVRFLPPPLHCCHCLHTIVTSLLLLQLALLL